MTRPVSPKPMDGQSKDGADELWYARAILADFLGYDDPTVAAACQNLIDHTQTDAETRARALDMLVLVEGEAA